MKLRDILNTVNSISQNNPNISEGFICGGIPRDKFIGQAKAKFEDVDLTTGDASIKFLAEEFAIQFGKNYALQKKVGADGHVSIILENLKIDFSTNFVVPGIEKLLADRGITRPTDMQKEMFSRDFTCNALLLKLNLKDTLDPTHRGLADIKEGVLRTCLDPNSTFNFNTNRIPRIFYMSAKLGFDVDPKIIDWLRKNPNVIRKTEGKYITEKLNKAMQYDADRTVQLITATNMWDYIPISPALMPYFKKKSVTG